MKVSISVNGQFLLLKTNEIFRSLVLIETLYIEGHTFHKFQ